METILYFAGDIAEIHASESHSIFWLLISPIQLVQPLTPMTTLILSTDARIRTPAFSDVNQGAASSRRQMHLHFS